MSFSLVSYNTHWCTGTDGIYDPARVARAVFEANDECTPDVACFQEVHSDTSAFPNCHQSAEVSAHLGHGYWCDGHVMRGHPRKRDGIGTYGNSISSKYPLTFLGQLQFELPTPICGKTRFGNDTSEPRGAMAVRVQAPFASFDVVTVHLGVSLSGKEQDASVQQLVQWDVARRADVICGDFNHVTWSSALRRMREWGDDAWLVGTNTRPYFAGCTHKCFRIDYVFVKKNAQAISASVYKNGAARTASDHYPLCARIRLHRTGGRSHTSAVGSKNEEKQDNDRKGKSN